MSSVNSARGRRNGDGGRGLVNPIAIGQIGVQTGMEFVFGHSDFALVIHEDISRLEINEK